MKAKGKSTEKGRKKIEKKIKGPNRINTNRAERNERGRERKA